MYAKVFRQIYDGTLATNGPWEALVTFQQLLILANDAGEVDMTVAAIARITTIPQHVIERGIAALTAPDPESRTPDMEGRRIVLLGEGRNWGWRIVNYLKYRAIQKEEERREYHRRYYHEVRKPAKSVDVQQPQPISTGSTDSTDTEADTEAEEEAKKGGLAVSADQLSEANLETGGKPAKKRAKRIDCPPEVDEQVWEDWLQLRKAKKAPVTETVLRSAIGEAQKAGMTLEQFLRVWCVRGSQGLQADWLRPDERSPPRQTATDRRVTTINALTGKDRQHGQPPSSDDQRTIEGVTRLVP